jgi:hypothetical protein
VQKPGNRLPVDRQIVDPSRKVGSVAYRVLIGAASIMAMAIVLFTLYLLQQVRSPVSFLATTSQRQAMQAGQTAGYSSADADSAPGTIPCWVTNAQDGAIVAQVQGAKPQATCDGLVNGSVIPGFNSLLTLTTDSGRVRYDTIQEAHDSEMRYFSGRPAVMPACTFVSGSNAIVLYERRDGLLATSVQATTCSTLSTRPDIAFKWNTNVSPSSFSGSTIQAYARALKGS